MRRLHELGIHTRAVNALEAQGIKGEYALAKFTPEQLMLKPWVGKKVVSQIEGIMAGHGMSLRNPAIEEAKRRRDELLKELDEINELLRGAGE